MRRTKQEAAETRAALLDAAERLFHEQGVSGTTLAQIAAAAKLTRGAVYWHFKNKLDLFRAMQDRVRLPEEEFFHDGDVAAFDDCLSRLHTATLAAVRFIAADERVQRVYGILLFRCEYVGEMEEALTRRREADEAMKATIVAVFERARELGQLRPAWQPRIAADAYCCSMSGLLSEWLRLERSFDLVETATATIDSLFASFATEQCLEASFRPAAPVSAAARCKTVQSI